MYVQYILNERSNFVSIGCNFVLISKYICMHHIEPYIVNAYIEKCKHCFPIMEMYYVMYHIIFCSIFTFIFVTVRKGPHWFSLYFFPCYVSQWATSKLFGYQHSSKYPLLCLTAERNLRMIRWCQSFHFWMNYPFNFKMMNACVYVCNNEEHELHQVWKAALNWMEFESRWRINRSESVRG